MGSVFAPRGLARPLAGPRAQCDPRPNDSAKQSAGVHSSTTYLPCSGGGDTPLLVGPSVALCCALCAAARFDPAWNANADSPRLGPTRPDYTLPCLRRGATKALLITMSPVSSVTGGWAPGVTWVRDRVRGIDPSAWGDPRPSKAPSLKPLPAPPRPAPPVGGDRGHRGVGRARASGFIFISTLAPPRLRHNKKQQAARRDEHV